MPDTVDERRMMQDTGFLALQRPAMIYGVPYIGCVLNLAINVDFGAWFGLACGHRWWMFLWWVSVAPAIHLVMKGICNRDHHLFRIFQLWLQTKAASPTNGGFGGPSLAAFSTRHKPDDFSVSLSWRNG